MSEPWFLYAFHLHKRLAHAQHYTGITTDPIRREREHVRGQGSPLIKAAIEAGITYSFIIISEHKGYSDAKEAERRRKNRGGAKKWRPVCKSQRRKV